MINNLDKIILPTVEQQQVPDVSLCRFFSKQEYLDDFNNGKYRFGNLRSYQKKEFDSRCDPTELESSFYGSGGHLYFSHSFGYYYALCFTELNEDTQVKTLSEKFGTENQPAIMKKIPNNLQLTQNIINAFKESEYRSKIPFFQWYQVVYNKNQRLDQEYQENPPDDLLVYQKPPQHIIYKLSRIKKTPLEPTKPGQPEVIDCGGDIGTIWEFSNLKPLEIRGMESLISSGDYIRIDSEINDFSIEKEWRLVFYSDTIDCDHLIF